MLYASAGRLGVAALDLVDPDAPLFRGFLSTGPPRRIVASVNGLIVVSGSAVDVLPVDCSTPANVTGAPPSPPESPRLSLKITRNPFVNETSFEYAIPGHTGARLDVFDVAGRRVRSLRAFADASGRGSVRWDGRDASSRVSGAGVYLVRLQAGERFTVCKVVRMR